MIDMKSDNNELVELTTTIVSAYVSNNTVVAGDLPTIIGDVHDALSRASVNATQPPAEEFKPAVPVKRSVTPEYIVCLEDGKKQKMLKRHLMTNHEMTPADYRQKWGLSSEYPMVAPNYAEQRRTLAKSIGLGTKRRRTRKGK